MTWITDNLVFFLIVGLVIIITSLGFVIYESDKTEESPTPRSGSRTTIATLFLGIAVALLGGIILWGLLYGFTSLASWAIVVMSVVFAWIIFQSGRFTVLEGEGGFMKFLGTPFGRLGPGYGWVLPGIMKVVTVNTQAFIDSGENDDSYRTGDNIELLVDSDASFAVSNPREFATIEKAAVLKYVNAARQDVLRAHIHKFTVNNILRDFLNKDLSPGQLMDPLEKIRILKNDITNNGGEELLRELNSKVEKYGLIAEALHIKNVFFNKEVEKKAQRLFEEGLEAPGLQRDASSKGMMADTLFNSMLKSAGLTRDELTKEERMLWMEQAMAAAMAIEDKGTFVYINGKHGGSRVFINPNKPSTSGKPPETDEEE